MNEQLHHPGQPEEPNPITPEVEPEPDPPRIYVASLADYNNGRLHGEWIEVGPDVEIEDVHAQVRDMLTSSPEPGAEEYAIHDYEGFGEWRVDEYESLNNIHRAAELIGEHGPAFAAWLEYWQISFYQEDPDDLADMFAEKYIGEYTSVQEWAEALVSDHGAYDELSTGNMWADQYLRIDYDAMCNDLEMSHVIVQPNAWTVWVFDQ